MSDVQREDGQWVLGPCGARSQNGDTCDLYVDGPPHGGLMHSGVRDGARIWWSKATGRVIDFGAVSGRHIAGGDS